MSSEHLTSESSPTRERSQLAVETLLRHHVWGAMGVGVIPLPLVDIAALTGVQLNLLRKLGVLYNRPLAEQTATKIISALLSGVVTTAVGPSLAVSLAKILPLVGPSLCAATMPLLFGASTYALGKVFIQHFESGGTFLTFNPENVRAYYATMFQEGKRLAADMRSHQAKPTAFESADAPAAVEPPTAPMEDAPVESSDIEPIDVPVEPSDVEPIDVHEEERQEIQHADSSTAQEPDSSSKKSRRRKAG